MLKALLTYIESDCFQKVRSRQIRAIDGEPRTSVTCFNLLDVRAIDREVAEFLRIRLPNWS